MIKLLKLKMIKYVHICVSESKYFECPVRFWLVRKMDLASAPKGVRVGFPLIGII